MRALNQRVLGRRAVLAGGGAALLPNAAPLPSGPLRVASKPDTEGRLLAALMVQALRARGIAVADMSGLGPTRIVRAALLAGAIDLYPEYTGNGASFFHRPADPAWRDAAAGAALVRRLDAAQFLVWLPAAPADNGWGLAVPAALAAASHLASLDDFARYVHQGGRVCLVASAEFIESPQALPAFQASYGFRLRGGQIIMLAGGNTAASLRAAAQAISGANVAMAYGTDGALSVLGMQMLADPRRAEPVYAPAPVVRAAALAARPQIAPILAPVFAALETATLQRLNACIAVYGQAPAEVAAAFLERLPA